MKKPRKKILYHIVNIVTIAMIVECFLCAMLMVEKNARDNCFDRIEENASQMAAMFRHAMEDREEKLMVFADILTANTENPDALLQAYMENFCKTQDFSAVCIHRQDGTSYSYGRHPHDDVNLGTFESEASKAPYVSDNYSYGKLPEENYIYLAVPLVRSGRTYAVLYGYIPLDVFPSLLASDVYDGNRQFCIVDGETGAFLMDEYRGELGNLFDDNMDAKEPRNGYDVETMIRDVKAGESGYFVFRSQQTRQWNYTYYMPLGINNWSMQLTIDEPTAFEAYRTISHTMVILMVVVIGLIILLIASLMTENARVNRMDKARLRKSNYMNAVQKFLLNAYTNTDAVVDALRTVAEEMQAETVLLLSFSDNTVTNAQYWPSSDKPQAMDLMGRNIREDFPVLYDLISTGASMVYNKDVPALDISETATEMFQSMDISRLILVPIRDMTGRLKGAISAVNIPADMTPEMMECVVYDFSMAINNLESHSIIKKMGAYDYLTGLKNRNSFETETMEFATMPGESLWCAYVDVNGLHELNNQQGHKAGDRMLCVVADTIRKIFGGEYTYRLGGDEFVAFQLDSSHDAFMRYKYRLLDELRQKGYSVSVGFGKTEKNRNGVFDVEQVLADAETIMYRDKREFYEKSGTSSEREHFVDA